MKPMTDDELRQVLMEYTGINDGYVKCLAAKDAVILRLNSEAEGLHRRIEELENAYDIPKGGEGSE